MSRISYVNGRYVPHHLAMIHIEDRGYQFSDAVYEGFEIYQGKIVDFDPHIARLKRSLSELGMAMPDALPALGIIFRELIRKNYVSYGFAYLQVSRGVAPRNHAFPSPEIKPSIVATVRSVSQEQKQKSLEEGISVLSTDDMRWSRVDIKSVSLLPNVLAKEEAAKQGAAEAWLIDREGFVTEGAASNAWIVEKKGCIRTRRLDGHILPGITRKVVLSVAQALDMDIVQEKFTLQDALDAEEAFNTGASSVVMPVTRLNGEMIGDGQVGPVVKALQASFREHSTT